MKEEGFIYKKHYACLIVGISNSEVFSYNLQSDSFFSFFFGWIYRSLDHGAQNMDYIQLEPMWTLIIGMERMYTDHRFKLKLKTMYLLRSCWPFSKSAKV